MERARGQADLHLASVGLFPDHEVPARATADELLCFRGNEEAPLWVRLEKERTRTHVTLFEDHEDKGTGVTPRAGPFAPAPRSRRLTRSALLVCATQILRAISKAVALGSEGSGREWPVGANPHAW
jgi:hypothetical protein